MGERAECVMLNKGPHIVEAVRVLDNVLRRMEAHQSKKAPNCASYSWPRGFASPHRLLKNLDVATVLALQRHCSH